MARISIQVPEKFIFKTEISVRVDDLNYGNHLGNDRLLTIAHESRIRFLKSLGYKDEISIEGLGIIVSDAAVVYKAEAFLHDLLTIEIGISEISKVGFDLIYQVSKKDNGIVVALIKTGIVFLDYSLKKVKPVPQEFLEKLP